VSASASAITCSVSWLGPNLSWWRHHGSFGIDGLFCQVHGDLYITWLPGERLRPHRQRDAAADQAHYARLGEQAATGPVGSVDEARLQRVVDVMQQFIGFPSSFNINSMLMNGG